MAAEQERTEGFTLADLEDAWPVLAEDDRAQGFAMLPRHEAEEFFLRLSARDSAELVLQLPPEQRRSWLRLLPPDDAADVVQHAPREAREALLGLLDDFTRKEVTGLLRYAEDQAGGLMNPRFALVRPAMTVHEALSYVHKQAREHVEGLYYVYVVDDEQRLVGVVSLRGLLGARPEQLTREVMETEVVAVDEHADQEEVGRLFAQHDLIAIPVIDAQRRIKGIVTVDDIVDVVQQEATEDAQKFGGMESLDEPYLAIDFWRMAKKRGGWLAALFLGEMLTATAMASYEDQIAKAVVLALFVPLIISSGGNSGAQASTLVIRAMAVGEVRLRDWWRVMRRELAAGLALGTLLGAIGFLRIVVWQAVRPIYGEHYVAIAATLSLSLIGVVTLGTLAGSLLPFLLRRVGLDPASASAPFVATLVDVTGLVIYFSVAAVLLSGKLL